ncbi:MarR family winged helix-turn-helix transcriptional regulator [Deinococcus sp. VB343]|uniref:MarR family winged helix-turn-helix transcriptional regulator n=1 Tax=Deinococcus sp. VB343 TaxID=3385567 RepID=UPI0039C9C334
MSKPASKDTPLPLLADRLVALTWALARKLRSEGHADSPLTLSQLAILSHLERQPGLTGAELARAEMVTPQSMNAAVGELRRLELIDAQPSSSDGRRLALSLTGAGSEALQQTRERRAAWLVAFLEQELSAEEREHLDVALAALQRAGLG